MALSQSEIAELKKQLHSQIQHLPPEKRAEAQQQIDELSPEALEHMIKQQTPKNDKGIFRKIVDGEIPSKKVDENKSAIAVIDIRPASMGHIIVIPKKPVKESKDIPTPTLTLAKKVAKKIVSKLKAKGTELQTENKFGEVIVNVIPHYNTPVNINSPRYEATDEELSKVYEKLKTVKKERIPRVKKSSSTINLSRKIPE